MHDEVVLELSAFGAFGISCLLFILSTADFDITRHFVDFCQLIWLPILLDRAIDASLETLCNVFGLM
jgi:hypothetical protein